MEEGGAFSGVRFEAGGKSRDQRGKRRCRLAIGRRLEAVGQGEEGSRTKDGRFARMREDGKARNQKTEDRGQTERTGDRRP